MIKTLIFFRRYLNQLAKLVDAIHILCGTCISESSRKKATKLLNSFVNELKELYGPENMVYNVHQLKHLSECVKRNGPLYAYSNYPMEDYIGHLVNFVKGTTDVTTQTCSRYILEKNLHIHLQKSHLAKEYYERIESKLSFPIARKIGGSLVIGKPKKICNLNIQELNLIRNSLSIEESTPILEYRAAFLNNRDYYETVSYNYLRKRTNDSFVFNPESNCFAEIDAIIVIEELLYFLISEKFRKITDPNCKHVHFLVENTSPKQKIINSEAFVDKFAVIKFDSTIAAAKFPNHHERN